MATTQADVVDLRRRNQNVVGLAKRALEVFWASLDLTRPEAARDALLEFLPQLVAAYGETAATLASDWYETVRARDVGGRFSALNADTVSEEQIQKSVRYQAGLLFGDDPSLMLTAMGGSVQRFVTNNSRATIQANAFRDPAKPRYARVPTGSKTCAFCSLLASRGFAYATAQSAKFKGGGDKYHNDCDCQAVADFSDDPSIEGYNPGELYSLYRSARAASGASDVKSIAFEMRRQNPDLFTDGVVASN